MGSLLMYLLWRVIYQARMSLSYYPAELSLSLELLWGALVGLGPFLGITTVETIYTLQRQTRDPGKQERRSIRQSLGRSARAYWVYPFLGGLGGLVGGVIWWYLAVRIHQSSTTLAMTILWATTYTVAILSTPLILTRPKQWRSYVTFLPALVLLPVASFLITRWLHIAPDQADVDMSVGLWLRVALIVGALLIVPRIGRARELKYRAAGEHINLLTQTIAQKKTWLRKKGVLMYLAGELAYSPDTIRKFCSGERRPSAQATKRLVEIGKESCLDRQWGRGLLEATHHFSDDQIVDLLNSIFGQPQ
jgi:hypothetical protein